MWLIPIFAGLAGMAIFKSKGGAKGLGKDAGIALVKSARDEAKAEARKVYKVAIDAGQHPAKAMRAAALAMKKLIS